MTHALSLAALCAALTLAAPAGAACFADYKAKQDDPLRLHYGVIELPDAACVSDEAAIPVVRERVEAGGWTLLNVLGLFDEAGLETRREAAGEFFLEF